MAKEQSREDKMKLRVSLLAERKTAQDKIDEINRDHTPKGSEYTPRENEALRVSRERIARLNERITKLDEELDS